MRDTGRLPRGSGALITAYLITCYARNYAEVTNTYTKLWRAPVSRFSIMGGAAPVHPPSADEAANYQHGQGSHALWYSPRIVVEAQPRTHALSRDFQMARPCSFAYCLGTLGNMMMRHLLGSHPAQPSHQPVGTTLDTDSHSYKSRLLKGRGIWYERCKVAYVADKACEGQTTVGW